MSANLGVIDTGILILYALICVGMGVYYSRKARTSEQFMLAGQSIPAWAAGIAVMSAYVSSISYIAVPGQAYDTNWHPAIFVLCIPPIVWFVCWYIIPYYRRIKLVSVYGLLENSLGRWARLYSALSFVIYMIGRSAVIIYLTALLVGTFIPVNIVTLIIIIGVITVFYTLVGGMEAVIWTDVMQSLIMIGGLLFCVVLFTKYLFTGSEQPIKLVTEAGKFSLGSLDFSFSTRTIWVMIIYSITENLRNLIADQNYVQKYSTVADERSAKKAIIISMALYIPMTPVFLYIGTSLFAFYHTGGHSLPANITKGDQVFPFFIATQLPVGLKGLIIAAIIAAAMSTLSSTLNSSATVLLMDFVKWLKPDFSEKKSLSFLRWTTVVWGGLSIIFAVLMIKAQSALNIWWEISGIFGGGILGLFILALCKVKLKLWQGLAAVFASVLVISWVTFARNLPENLKWAQCNLDPILAGACGIAILITIGFIFGFFQRRSIEH
jgi:SSS family solute:Na+ symporter